jgi:F-type H+-transporting ATPase subunit b
VNFNLTLIGQTIAFIFFVWFTMEFVWPLLLRQMEARDKKIADGLAAGEKGQEKLEQAEQRYRELVDEGKQQAAEIIAQAHKRGDEIVEESKQTARTEVSRILEAARAEIEQQKEAARADLQRRVSALALEGAEQILMREVDRKAHNDLLEKITARL